MAGYVNVRPPHSLGYVTERLEGERERDYIHEVEVTAGLTRYEIRGRHKRRTNNESPPSVQGARPL